MNPSSEKSSRLSALLLVTSLATLGVFFYINTELGKNRSALEAELTQTKKEYAATSAGLLRSMDELNQLLATTTIERDDLRENLQMQQDMVDSMRVQVQSVLGTVDTLTKLTNTDRELLQKYSRVYFLNENYVPRVLAVIPAAYLHEPTTEKRILADAWPFLQDMMDDATNDGIGLRVISAYRSFGAQSILKSTYTMTYGGNTANKFSADQGYSEHQLGSTVDFTTVLLGAKFTLFEQASAYRWLTENAYRYGFVLSYPKGNIYYTFEPWHWRFVGKKLAQSLHDQGKHFYDLPQRTIDAYLPYLFDG